MHLRRARAGSNLVCALTIATCYRRPEPYAERAWNTGIVPRAVALGCGILQVPGELHAFHALPMRKAARDCWRDKFSFLERQLAAAAP